MGKFVASSMPLLDRFFSLLSLVSVLVLLNPVTLSSSLTSPGTGSPTNKRVKSLRDGIEEQLVHDESRKVSSGIRFRPSGHQTNSLWSQQPDQQIVDSWGGAQVQVITSPAHASTHSHNLHATGVNVNTQNYLSTDVESDSKVTVSNPAGPLVEDIKCETRDGYELFTALVTLPAGFSQMPILSDAPHINPATNKDCIMQSSDSRNGPGVYLMKITNFHTCGVGEKKGVDDKPWYSVSLRFPYVSGLLMKEDATAVVTCRPHDRTITRNLILDAKLSMPAAPKSVFSNSAQDFECKMSLLTKRVGRADFDSALPSDGGLVEVGQDLQLKVTVRSGDGWKMAKLKDVVVQKVPMRGPPALPVSYHQEDKFATMDGQLALESQNKKYETIQPANVGNSLQGPVFIPNSQNHNSQFSSFSLGPRFSRTQQRRKRSHLPSVTMRQIPDAAVLVFSDGCRNPAMRSAAPHHPSRDSQNPLQILFSFKAFMFQDMEDGDLIRITAKVTACVDSIECQPAVCRDDESSAFARGKRAVSLESHAHNGTRENFEQSFQLRVVIPERLQQPAEALISADQIEQKEEQDSHLKVSPVKDIKCRRALLAVSCLGAAFSVGSTIVAIVAVRLLMARRLSKK